MKRVKYIFGSLLLLSMSSCQSYFLDLEPLSSITESVYFTEADHFREFSNNFYNKIISLRTVNSGSVGDFLDLGSDLTSYSDSSYGKGSITAPESDTYWTNCYDYIRDNNMLLEKAEEFDGDQDDIAQYVAAAKFFRAWHHYWLVQRFGGVPLITRVLDLDSEEIYSKRNSRYEVVAQVLEDLDDAIEDLPREQDISSSDKGKVSRWAAKAFKARVLLHEATWMRYVGTTTDGDGTSNGAGSAGYDASNITPYLTEAAELAAEVISDGGYTLWNYNSLLDNLSMFYLFNLEDSGSNPAMLTKATNTEFIFYGMTDYNLYQGNYSISHVVHGRMAPSRKFMDMFLCSDGLPIDQSTLFKGYYNTSDEYQNRDYRLTSYFNDWSTYQIPEDGSVYLLTGPSTSGDSGSGYSCQKFGAYEYGSYRSMGSESQNWPHIRLAEVYLIYAEALLELNGELTDTQLEFSINKTRARAGLPSLTLEFMQTNGLDIQTELRRERTVELYGENKRYIDLTRWGIAEEELNVDICGSVIEDTNYEDNLTYYIPGAYPYGELSVETGVGMRRVLWLEPAANRNFQRKHYLYPLPTGQILLNGNLLQNPEY
ncbi:MAG: RagB/SusD family nutrient uptake outer membrane protein [Rikenellaceae bacterium]